jgi:signal transduction histidine kinase
MPYLEDYATRRIRVLHVEDDPTDSELVEDQLRDARIDADVRRVDDEAATRTALAEFRPDIVLSDLSMPGFSGYRALELVREHSRYVPFIFVSGTMGEETAVAALRQGATDYIIKNNPARLVPAVERALREARDRVLRDRTEAELLRSQRLDSLALLAGGLSHDLRNILQPLLMVAPLIAENSHDERLRRLGELVEDCARRGLDMVASMLAFARGSRRASAGRVPLRQLLRALDLLLQGTLPRNVTLHIPDVEDALGFEGNDTELQQCLLNLCLNAIQAMPEGGTLTLAAGTVDLEQPTQVGDTRLEPGNYLLLRVADTGVGMSEEIQQRLFTPFFTTKKDGTGLGLMSCRRIVDNHRGAMQLVSAPGRGTRFEIYLPTRSAEEQALPAGIAANDASVLVVGEEAGSLSMLGDSLSLQGYRARIAQGGAAAIRAIEEQGLPDLVVLDADMRLLSSVRTLLQLQERAYAGPVLLLVDDGPTPTPDELPETLRIEFVRKPVALPQLLGAVQRALAAAGPVGPAVKGAREKAGVRGE